MKILALILIVAFAILMGYVVKWVRGYKQLDDFDKDMNW